jgi:elongation factor P
MAFSTNDLKNGMTLDLENDGLWTVVEFQHVKPGKGGAFVRTKLRNARTGQVVERTFRAGEKVEQAIVDKREMQYLYAEGNEHVFMDNSTYDQMHVAPASLGDALSYTLPGSSILMMVYKHEIIGVEMPASVDLTVIETEPGLQGDRSSAGRKPAKVETGLSVGVPLFVNQGDKIKVDTRSGEYITRVS